MKSAVYSLSHSLVLGKQVTQPISGISRQAEYTELNTVDMEIGCFPNWTEKLNL